jgi:hypothetical protein
MEDHPEWWDWELDLSIPHLQKRMVDRNFSETDLRTMLEDATGYHGDYEPGRYVIETRHGGCPWEIVVEPQVDDQTLMVISAWKAD